MLEVLRIYIQGAYIKNLPLPIPSLLSPPFKEI